MKPPIADPAHTRVVAICTRCELALYAGQPMTVEQDTIYAGAQHVGCYVFSHRTAS